jgi:hypothetical protein
MNYLIAACFALPLVYLAVAVLDLVWWLWTDNDDEPQQENR